MAIPKYQHIKDELKQQIISGKFENGDKFYTEAELIKIYDVSSITLSLIHIFGTSGPFPSKHLVVGRFHAW